MFAKIIEGKIAFICCEKIQEDMVEVSDENYNILLNGGTFENGEFIEYKESIEESIEKDIQKINSDFDTKISQYLSKYPQREQDTFSEKKREAEKVLRGESSIYIEGKAKVLGITSEQFANIVIEKNNEWTKLYTELENEKDLQVAMLKAKLKN